MTGENSTNTKTAKSGKYRASRPAPAAAKAISRADVRRGTYSPSRPAGVHARELGLGTKRS